MKLGPANDTKLYRLFQRSLALLLAVALVSTSTPRAQANGFTQAAKDFFKGQWDNSTTVNYARSKWANTSMAQKRSAREAESLGLRSAMDVLSDKTNGLLEDLSLRVGRGDYLRTVDINGYMQKIIANLIKQTQEFTFIVGEKGVGKTQYAYGTVERINMSLVPGALEGARVIRVNPPDLIAMSQDSESLVRLLREAEGQLISQKGPLVLYFDNVEKFVNDEDGVVAFLNLVDKMKATLGKNHQVKVLIEANTKEFETLAKGSRRFQGTVPVTIKAITKGQSLQVLRASVERLTSGRIKDLPDAVLKKAIELAERYNSETGLPNSAIDLLDATFAWRQVFIKDRTMPLITELETALENLKGQKTEVDLINKPFALELRESFGLEIKALEAQIKTLKESFADVFGLQNELDELAKSVQGMPEGQIPAATVAHIQQLRQRLFAIDERDLAMTVHQTQGVPLAQLLKIAHRRSLTEIISELKMYIKGQDHVVYKVAQAIRDLENPLRTSKKPLSFLLLGSTGTGKTEIWKAISRVKHDIFDLRYDLSEFNESHSIAKLIGSPPGYEGSKEGGQLVVQVIRKKRVNLLGDELNTAHENIRKLFLQILDDGKLADGIGNVAEFDDSIIVMTANWALNVKPGASRSEVLASVAKEGVEPQFLARFTHVEVMNQHTRESLGEVLVKFIQQENAELLKNFNRISLTPAAHREILNRLEGGLNSGRDVLVLFNEFIKNPFYEALSEGYYHTGMVSNSGKLRARVLPIERGDDVIFDFSSESGFSMHTRIAGEEVQIH